MKDATAYNDEVAEKDEAAALAAIKASGKSTVYAPTAAELDAWAKATEPVIAEMADRVGGKAFIESVRAASKNYRVSAERTEPVYGVGLVASQYRTAAGDRCAGRCRRAGRIEGLATEST